MTWPWRSPDATRQGLSARVSGRYPATERQQRLREIAYRRLLFRLFDAQPERWIVKGGAALLLRLDPNRTSNDIDLAYVVEAGEHAIALKALREAADHDAGDFFEFEIGSGHVVDPDHPLERALSVPVVGRIGEKEFARFSVDLALPRDDLQTEWIQPRTEVTGEAAVDAIPRVATLTFAAQLADKLCAVYERHGERNSHSSRARDLADIAMIAAQVDLDGGEIMRRVAAEERRRIEAGTLTEPLPKAFELAPEQRDDWQRRWKKATRGAPISFEEAITVTQAFMNPVMDRTVDRARWTAAKRSWSPT